MNEAATKDKKEFFDIFYDYYCSNEKSDELNNFLVRREIENMYFELATKNEVTVTLLQEQDKDGAWRLTKNSLEVYWKIANIKVNSDVWDIEERPENEKLVIKFRRKQNEKRRK